MKTYILFILFLPMVGLAQPGAVVGPFCQAVSSQGKGHAGCQAFSGSFCPPNERVAIIHGFYPSWLLETTATYSFQEANFLIYPNPASANFTISAPDGYRLKTVEVTDILGRLRLQSDWAGPFDQTFSTADLGSGIYYLRLFTTGQDVFQTPLQIIK